MLNGLVAGVCVMEESGGLLLYANPAFARLWLAEEPDGPCCVLLPGLQDQPEQDEYGLEFHHRRRRQLVPDAPPPHRLGEWRIRLAGHSGRRERRQGARGRELAQQERLQKHLAADRHGRDGLLAGARTEPAADRHQHLRRRR
ncbi:hypothetical protein JOS77_17430 [Chromobacterium haemolyticum]|nr:hypothetical protein JOS77_17430 [Chromobacterium haemolyticum]